MRILLALLAMVVSPGTTGAQDRGSAPRNGVTERAIVLRNGVRDELIRGEAPRVHLQQCLARNTRDACLGLLVYWGEEQVNRSYLGSRPEQQAEAARGWQFLILGFQELLTDLQSARSDADRQDCLARHGRLELSVVPLSARAQDTPAAARDAGLDYFFAVWDRLPEQPTSLGVFRHKFQTGEQIKRLLYDLGLYSDASAGLVTRAIHFYEQAVLFHQQPLPGLDASATPPDWSAVVQEHLRITVRAYVRLPGDASIVPRRLLAHTDINDRRRLLERIARSGSTPDERIDQAVSEGDKIARALKIAELAQWYNIAKRRNDQYQVANVALEVVRLQIQQGLLSEAQEGIQEVREIQKQIGDLAGWGISTLTLASHTFNAERWAEALELIDQAKPVLRDVLELESLQEAFEYEDAGRAKLHLPPKDFSLTGVQEAVRLQANAAALNGESDRTKRRDALHALLDVPNASPWVRLKIAMQLLDTLRELHDLDGVSRLVAEWQPEIRRWLGVSGEVQVQRVLLENDLERGDLGAFYRTVGNYETAARRLRGENWQDPVGTELARAFVRVQDYRRAETLLADHERLDEEADLRDPGLVLGQPDTYHLEDLLLGARMQLERGRMDEALPTVRRLEDMTTGRPGSVHRTLPQSSEVSFEIAQILSAADQTKEALAQVRRLLSGISPLSDTALWVNATLEEARLAQALGEPIEAQVATLEGLVPNLVANPEITRRAEHVADIDLFLSDYYVQRGATATAVQRLQRALTFSQTQGFLDPQIVAHRKLGEIAMAQGDQVGAVESFRRSMARLDEISQRIPSDVGKVGYRRERNKAAPLLVEALYEIVRHNPSPPATDQLVEAIEAGKARALTEVLLPVSKDSATPAIKAEALRAALPADEALLEFFAPETSDRVFRVLITRTSTDVDVLNLSAKDLSARVGDLTRTITGIQSYSEPAFKAAAAALASLLLPSRWAASFDAIPFRRLFIVPTGPLHQYPFATLVDQRGRYLDDAEQLEIASLPSATMLLRPPPRLDMASRSATFIGPEGERSQHEVLEGVGPLRDQLRTSIDRWRRGEFAWEEPMTAAEFLRRAQTLDNVFLYAHARFLPDDPVSSYIRFAGTGDSASEVAAADFLQTRVGNGLWVIAACSTGRGVVRPGDEVLGLPRALLVAGAGMVVISLWDVDAGTSFQMMVRFYEGLAGGRSVAAALRDARVAARKAGLPPYDWAPFVLVGHHGF